MSSSLRLLIGKISYSLIQAIRNKSLDYDIYDIVWLELINKFLVVNTHRLMVYEQRTMKRRSQIFI